MNKETTKLTPWSWEAIGALCCFAGGIAAGIVGSVLTALTWIVGGEVHPWVRGVGTGFLILTIPLLILAGYCMDWMERKPKNQPEETSCGEDGNVSLAQIFTAAIFLGVILIGPIEARSQQIILRSATTLIESENALNAESEQLVK